MQDLRSYWVQTASRIATPVLTALAEGQLRQKMPVEAAAGYEADRAKSSHLEAWCRTLCGLAPWLEADLEGADPEEITQRDALRDLTVTGLTLVTQPSSPDYLPLGGTPQSLVEGAFLARALLHAPRALWERLDQAAQQRLINELKNCRQQLPGFNNWLLFPAEIELFLLIINEGGDPLRIEFAMQQFEQWYAGDGAYNDGPHFVFDYYNSLVIQPMMLDIVQHLHGVRGDWESFRDRVITRAQRYAAVQERMISPEGAFPITGRSLAYRSAAFQHLAQCAWQHLLPPELSPPGVRGALTAVIRRLFEAPGTFDENDWLRIGLCGHQPSIGEPYVSTGSLYLALTAFLPLALPPGDEFWSAPDQPWTSLRAFSGKDVPFDMALEKQLKTTVWTTTHQRVV